MKRAGARRRPSVGVEGRAPGEFALATRLIDERKIDLRPLLTTSFGLSDAKSAFEMANDRRKAMKVQLAF